MDWSKLTEQVSTIKVKNVVDMPLFYGLFFSLFGIIASVFSKYEWIVVVLFVFSGILLLIALFGYIFFSVKNPDYLRSEQYHLRKQSLEILGDKDNILPVDAQDIVQITNPYHNLIEENTIENQHD